MHSIANYLQNKTLSWFISYTPKCLPTVHTYLFSYFLLSNSTSTSPLCLLILTWNMSWPLAPALAVICQKALSMNTAFFLFTAGKLRLCCVKYNVMNFVFFQNIWMEQKNMSHFLKLILGNFLLFQHIQQINIQIINKTNTAIKKQLICFLNSRCIRTIEYLITF